MRIAPTDKDGRLLEGKTPFGNYRITIDEDFRGDLFDKHGNRVGFADIEFDEPPELLAKSKTHNCKHCEGKAD